MKKRKKETKFGKFLREWGWLLKLVLIILVVGLILFLLGQLISFSRTGGMVGCEPVENSIMDAVYPPDLPVRNQALLQEREVWSTEFENEDRYARLMRVLYQMSTSNMSVIKKVGVYAWNQEVNLYWVDNEDAMAIVFNTETRTFDFAVSRPIFDDLDDVELANVIVHEFGVHEIELQTERANLVSSGMPSDDAFDFLHEKAYDPLVVKCAEMRAYALESAGFYQFAHMGYIPDAGDQQVLDAILRVNWKWKASSWADALGEDAWKLLVPTPTPYSTP